MSAQYTIFNIKKENHPKLFQTCSYGILFPGFKNEFEISLVNEPLVFKPAKVYKKKVWSRKYC